MTLVRRHWRGPFSFWTVEHEGQRFIVKGLSKTSPTRPGRWYRRWAGTKEGFGKEIFLVPYKQSFGRAINQTTKTSSKFMKSGTAGTSHGRRSKQTSRTRSSASTAPSRQPTAPKRQRPKVKPEPADELQTELEQLEVGCSPLLCIARDSLTFGLGAGRPSRARTPSCKSEDRVLVVTRELTAVAEKIAEDSASQKQLKQAMGR